MKFDLLPHDCCQLLPTSYNTSMPNYNDQDPLMSPQLQRPNQYDDMLFPALEHKTESSIT